MTTREFDSLDEMEKIKAIAYNGHDLTKREDESYYYNLYQIDSFLVEEKIKKVSGGSSFLSPSHFSTKVEIEPYLEKIMEARKN